MSNPYLGEIRLFGGNFAIRGFAFCNGALLSIAQNDALYALLGTTYGGDGVNTFGLPNLQSRIPIGQGQGPGLSPRVVGGLLGSEGVTVTQANLPVHSHSFSVSSQKGTLTAPSSIALPAAPDLGNANTTASFYVDPNAAGAGATTLAPMSAGTVLSSGNSQPHNNIMPVLAVNYIIALEGVFPSRN